MLMNAVNIALLRMQNVQYPNNRSFVKAVRDLFVIDKHTMLYKGLVPTLAAFAVVQRVKSHAEVLFDAPFKCAEEVVAALVMMQAAVCLLAHPFFMVAIRIQCTPFCGQVSKKPPYSNSVQLVSHLFRTKGVFALYMGLVPSSVIYLLMMFPHYITLLKKNKDILHVRQDKPWRDYEYRAFMSLVSGEVPAADDTQISGGSKKE